MRTVPVLVEYEAETLRIPWFQTKADDIPSGPWAVGQDIHRVAGYRRGLVSVASGDHPLEQRLQL